MNRDSYWMNLETLLFFETHPEALPLYEAFESTLYALLPDIGKRVQKTQITFYKRYVFACASFARVKRKADLPDPYLVITLGLPYSLISDRIAAKSEPYPGRWTTHFVIGSPEEIDEEMITWIREAFLFSETK